MTLHKKTKHLFYCLKGTNVEEPFSIYAGQYKMNKGFLSRTLTTTDEEKWLVSFENVLSEIKSENIHLLVYIHGYLAENPWFASINGYTLHTEIFDSPEHDVNVVLSLLWDSGFNYSYNRLLAFQKGEVFQIMLLKMLETASSSGKKIKISFLLHSMGNIVFEGIACGKKKTGSITGIRQVFFCAADLKSDVFDKSLKNLSSYVQDLHVLYHQKDKTLQVANVMQNFRRLGIYGREDENQSENIHSLDATLLAEDDVAIGSRFSHHRYFYGSKTIVKYINHWLSKA